MIYFTSDTHFGHGNVIRYAHRPFSSTEEMDETMIRNWNERIGPEDDVYHLGDFALCDTRRIGSIIDRLMGRKHLIFGNHDRTIRKDPGLQRRFVWCKDMYELSVPDADAHRDRQKIVLCHYAMRVWNASHYGSFQIHGHSHGTLSQDPYLLQIDVGVDAVASRCGEEHAYAPVSYDVIKKYMKTRRWKPVDHHGAERET